MCHMTQPSCILREIFILRCSIICLFAYYYYCDSVAVALLFSTNATCQYRLLLCFHGVLNVPGVPVTSHCLCPAPWGICACKYGHPWQILCLPLAPLTAGTDTGGSLLVYKWSLLNTVFSLYQVYQRMYQWHLPVL